MRQKHTLFVMTGFLVMSAALITSLASANMPTDRKNKLMMHTQKLDTNDDDAITTEELTTRQERRFATLESNKN